MKKWCSLLVVIFLLSIACFLSYTSAKEGTFETSTTYIKLSYDMIPTYIDRISTEDHLVLRQHVSDSTQDLLYIESLSPYVRGVLIVQIPNTADLVIDTPLQFQVSWNSIDNNTFLVDHPQKELLGDLQIIGHLSVGSTQSAFIPDFDLVSFGASLEDCKEHTEEFLRAIYQVFQ